jgi:hypothetical protein
MSNYRLETYDFVFHDTPNTVGRATIAIGSVPEELINDPAFDERIFFYCFDEKDFESLFDKNNSEDFYLIKSE